MLALADDPAVQPEDRRELKRRVYAITSEAQELLEWISNVKLEEPRN